MSNLSNQLVIAERDEVARGIRIMLVSPLLHERGAPEQFDLVRRRREPITKWFDYYCGWDLAVEPRLGYARLAKVRPTADGSRPLRRRRSGQAPFDRRRYVLLCMAAAELLSVPVTTIGLLADRVARATAADPVVADFVTAVRGERMAFVDALRVLEHLGTIEVLDGATESFVDAVEAKVLYRVDNTLLMRLLSAPTGVSQLAVPAEEVPARFDELLSAVSRERRYGAAPEQSGHLPPVSEVQRNLWLRHSIFRRLVDDPVVYLDDLTGDERAYLNSPTGRQLLRRAASEGGFLVEERAEGVMFVDPDAIATDHRFPDGAGNAKVAALLLLDRIDAVTTIEQLRVIAGELLAKFPRWAKGYRGDNGIHTLVTEALDVLRGFGLVRVADGLVHPLPAAGRYAVDATRTSDPGEGTS
ncbi:TIGR02678 family protein [Labedaea rhizosphaerae]|uniref:Uncharacterized protein (TIGR02678 family) n=1 Tax=Labedaea rhizosphaerae TaxID=598644 RepID=A0A4R6RVY4_LABRH|nr:TIGR02678 family protein [Labedaea rhizosphaerae]TDP91189.1 uncharacterized protein (TIGR02678 family) [Labedaea rhizosphaerae]